MDVPMNSRILGQRWTPFATGGKVPGRPHAWLSLIAYCFVRAVGLALAMAVVLTGAALTLNAGQAKVPRKNLQTPSPVRTFSGMITDSYCHAKHDKNRSLSSAECVHTCVHEGAKYVLVNGDNNYELSGNLNGLDKVAGQRVKVVGDLRDNTLIVSSIDPGQ
jgi:hypothetical protein